MPNDDYGAKEGNEKANETEWAIEDSEVKMRIEMTKKKKKLRSQKLEGGEKSEK